MLKKIYTTVIMFFIMSSVAYAGSSSVTFAWYANTENDLAGYRLYQTQKKGIYNDSNVAEIPAGTETVVVNNLMDGTYYWVLTAFDVAENESEHSNEVTETIKHINTSHPAKVLNFRIEGVVRITTQ